MGRRSRPGDAEELRRTLVQLLTHFESELSKPDIRAKVRGLIPAFHSIRDLGASLLPLKVAKSGRDRILEYLLHYPFVLLAGEELMVVAGIDDWARRVRELRVEDGWPILSGHTLKAMRQENEVVPADLDSSDIKVDDYILLDTTQDREAAHRWKIANRIRRTGGAVREKLLRFLQANVGKPVTGEELRYVAREKTEWARRLRELRTEGGWAVVTRNTGRPDLPVGVYLLEHAEQAAPHDRKIPDDVRVEVLKRDGYSCVSCGWTRSDWRKEDPRDRLELHHLKMHVEGGANDSDNLRTLCNVCHDVVHRERHQGIE